MPVYTYSTVRFKAMTKWPYIAPAICSMHPVPQPGLGTWAVDKHWRIYYDPALLDNNWSLDELTAAMLHEVGHLLRGHHRQAENRNVESQTVANIAQDCEINDDLVKEGIHQRKGYEQLPSVYKLPDGNLWGWYYDQLMAQAQDPQGGGSGKGQPCHDCGSGAHGEVRPWEKPGPGEPGAGTGEDEVPAMAIEEQEIVRQDCANRIVEHAKKRGKVGAFFERIASDVLEPKVDWRRELAALVRRSCAVVKGQQDYSWRRLNRRSPPGFLLPSMVQPEVKVTIVLDTSGSMGEVELSAALGEIQGVIKSLPNQNGVRVLAADTDVKKAQKVFRAEQVSMVGGGGTDMRIPIAAAIAEKPSPDVVVVLTDGFTPWPIRPTRQQVVACIVGGNTVSGVPSWIRTVAVN